MRVFRNADEPPRHDQAWEQRWNGPDRGLIASWERGREKAREDPDLASAASRGELVPLPWKGGVEQATKAGRKYGPFFYLAMWQGLRGEPLDIETATDTTITCSRTGMAVTFTPDASKYSQKP
jgi:hypothetical protein